MKLNSVSLEKLSYTIVASFSELGISSVFNQALNENDIFIPSEIQVKSIPFLLTEGTDLIAQAQTGTGKTAAFGLPLLQKADPDNIHIQALILSPTRELGQQIQKTLFRFTKYGPKVFIEAVYGGAPIDNQIKALMRPTQIVVATPGRLIDLLERKAIDLSHVKTIVLDEADEMLSMGFKKDLDHILSLTTGRRHTWLFSATMPAEIKDIIDTYMSPDAFRIQVDKQNIVNKDIEHRFIHAEEKEKLNSLVLFLREQGENRGVIFCNTKNGATLLSKQLFSRNYSVDAIHGDLGQRDRDKVMRAFKNEKLQILVATDLAARGIDIDNLSYVVHYQLPEQMEYFTHRSGRTARAGKKGLSLCLVNGKELQKLKTIEATLGISVSNYKKQ
jgi:ATP-dependent RNA helicase DeaD